MQRKSKIKFGISCGLLGSAALLFALTLYVYVNLFVIHSTEQTEFFAAFFLALFGIVWYFMLSVMTVIVAIPVIPLTIVVLKDEGPKKWFVIVVLALAIALIVVTSVLFAGKVIDANLGNSSSSSSVSSY